MINYVKLVAFSDLEMQRKKTKKKFPFHFVQVVYICILPCILNIVKRQSDALKRSSGESNWRQNLAHKENVFAFEDVCLYLCLKFKAQAPVFKPI